MTILNFQRAAPAAFGGTGSWRSSPFQIEVQYGCCRALHQVMLLNVRIAADNFDTGCGPSSQDEFDPDLFAVGLFQAEP